MQILKEKYHMLLSQLTYVNNWKCIPLKKSTMVTVPYLRGNIYIVILTTAIQIILIKNKSNVPRFKHKRLSKATNCSFASSNLSAMIISSGDATI